MSHSIKGKSVELSSGRKVRFRYAIRDTLEIEGVIIVRLDVPVNRKLNENVYALDSQGDLLWQVKPVRHVYQRSPYVGIEKAGEFARLFNWDGNVYDVNPKTGDVISSYWGK